MLLVLSLVFVFLGYTLKGQGDIFQIVGFGFLFLLGVMIIPNTYGSLEYQTGAVNEYTYETILNASEVSIIEEVRVYSIYEDFTIGFFLSTASIFGLIQLFMSRKTNRGFESEEE